MTGAGPDATGEALMEVRIAVPDAESAQRMARDLVERRLAACVQALGPMTTVYSWQDEVHQSTEWLLLAKTTQAALGELTDVVVETHRYEVPEILAVPVTHALGPYATWIRDWVGPQVADATAPGEGPAYP